METRLRAQTKATPPSFASARGGLLQRKCACGGTPRPTGECEACRQKKLQRRAASQCSTFNPQLSEAPPIVHEVLRSPGQPLDVDTRAFFEPRFGHDFSGVRVHTDTKAEESARAVRALAYTVGRDVVFGAGQYAPAASDGRRLLAHELAHTIQQSQSPVGGTLTPTTIVANAVNDVYEEEANRVASELASDATARVHLRHSVPVIRRQKIPTGITLKEIKPFGHSELKSDEDKKKYRTNIGAVTLMQVTPGGDYSDGQKRGDCVKESLTEVSNTCPAFEFCTGNKCLEVNRFGTSGDPPTGMTVTDGPDTFIDRHVSRMSNSFLEGSGKNNCSVVCHQRYKYRTEPDKKYTDLGSFYIIRNFKAGTFTPVGSKDALHITSGEVKKVQASLEAPSKEKFAKDIAPGLAKSGALLEAPPVPKDQKP